MTFLEKIKEYRCSTEILSVFSFYLFLISYIFYQRAQYHFYLDISVLLLPLIYVPIFTYFIFSEEIKKKMIFLWIFFWNVIMVLIISFPALSIYTSSEWFHEYSTIFPLIGYSIMMCIVLFLFRFVCGLFTRCKSKVFLMNTCICIFLGSTAFLMIVSFAEIKKCGAFFSCSDLDHITKVAIEANNIALCDAFVDESDFVRDHLYSLESDSFTMFPLFLKSNYQDSYYEKWESNNTYRYMNNCPTVFIEAKNSLGKNKIRADDDLRACSSLQDDQNKNACKNIIAINDKNPYLCSEVRNNKGFIGHALRNCIDKTVYDNNDLLSCPNFGVNYDYYNSSYNYGRCMRNLLQRSDTFISSSRKLHTCIGEEFISPYSQYKIDVSEKMKYCFSDFFDVFTKTKTKDEIVQFCEDAFPVSKGIEKEKTYTDIFTTQRESDQMKGIVRISFSSLYFPEANKICKTSISDFYIRQDVLHHNDNHNKNNVLPPDGKDILLFDGKNFNF